MHQQLGNGQDGFFFLRDARTLDFRFLRELIRHIKTNNIDMVHSHEFFMNVYGTFAAALAGIPSVATVHGRLDYASSKRRRRMAYRLVTRTGCLVTVSSQLAGCFSKQIGAPEERIHTIYNGILLEMFQRQYDLGKLRSELGIDSEAPIVGMVGNLYPLKGYEYYVKAMEIVRRSFPHAIFLICGRGELQSELESLSAECGLRSHIKFLGFRNDVPALLQLVDIFVLSSLSEGLSLSILEAMAAGKPTVVTDVGGNREIVVEGETGFLVPSEDAKALAEKVCVLLKDRALAKRMGANGKRRVDSKFSQERMIRDYEDIYSFLLHRKSPIPQIRDIREVSNP
jgi:glycosyltransferase involved in cell wall biosynthesis